MSDHEPETPATETADQALHRERAAAYDEKIRAGKLGTARGPSLATSCAADAERARQLRQARQDELEALLKRRRRQNRPPGAI